MSREYSENVLVQNSAGNLLQNVLGWEVVLAYNSEKLGPDGTLGRTSYGEVLLTRYFRQALLRLNPWLTPNQLDEVQKKFTAHVSTASLMQINEEKYFLLRDGIPVTVKRPDGRTETRSAAVIDFKNPENNHFLAVKEMKIHSQLYRRRISKPYGEGNVFYSTTLPQEWERHWCKKRHGTSNYVQPYRKP